MEKISVKKVDYTNMGDIGNMAFYLILRDTILEKICENGKMKETLSYIKNDMESDIKESINELKEQYNFNDDVLENGIPVIVEKIHRLEEALTAIDISNYTMFNWRPQETDIEI